MKNKIVFLGVLILLSSCGRWIGPSYTSVNKMLSLEKGMTTSKVDEVLGIKPYNILHKNDSNALFEYHYRLKERDMTKYAEYDPYFQPNLLQTEDATWYSKPSKFFVLFENEKFSSLVTESGLKNAEYLLLKNNNLILVSESDLIDFKLTDDITFVHKTENFKKPKFNKSIKQRVLYSAYIPYGLLGLKYAVSGKIGGYVSSAHDGDVLRYFTFGLIAKASKNLGIYAGTGVAPYTVSIASLYYSHNDRLYSTAIETGLLWDIKRFTLEAGVGYTFKPYDYPLYDPRYERLIDNYLPLFFKLGFGVNF